MEDFRSFNICLLPTLGASAQQHDQRFAIPGKIDPISRPPIDDVFTDT
jgi:hypothetical protein